MKTRNLDKAYKTVAQIVQEDIKEKIKSGPTRAYKTGGLYNSVKSTVVPIQGGERIQVSMNYYAQYVNPPRRFIEAGLKQSDKEIEELIGKAAVEDIIIVMNEELD